MPTRYRPDPGAWNPSTSPWVRILPHFTYMCRRSDVERLFGGMRDFVALAAHSPGLANRLVYPSTINLAIFEVPGPIPLTEAHLHPRFIVSPLGPGSVRLRAFAAVPQRQSVQKPASVVELDPARAIDIISGLTRG